MLNGKSLNTKKYIIKLFENGHTVNIDKGEKYRKIEEQRKNKMNEYSKLINRRKIQIRNICSLTSTYIQST